MIPFNMPPFVEKSLEYMKQACEGNRKICGDGPFTKRASEWLEQKTGAQKALLTTSCSHALDMMMMLLDIGPGDEVILPSYNFVSGGNAIALRGGVCVFADIRPDTMNIDEAKLEAAVTPKTKAILAVHYAGVSCEMDAVTKIARRHGLAVLEDAAQGMMSTYKGKPLGAIGALGAYSFHETKNYSMGEGGALLVGAGPGADAMAERAEIIREKGTDRSKFWRGQVDKYTWQEVGSSYLPSDLCAAYMLPQLEIAGEINNARLAAWERYHAAFAELEQSGRIGRPHVPDGCVHNGHMYYLKCRDIADRTRFIEYMKQNGVMCTFHYVPLHSSPAGRRLGRFAGADEYTTKESERLVRLPMYYGLAQADQERVIECARRYFRENGEA